MPRALLLLACALAACSPRPDPAWSGYAEGEYVYVAATAGGTLQALTTRRGDTVDAGTPLFALEDTAERAARDEAAARADTARAQARNTTLGRRFEDTSALRAQLAQARAQATLATRELARQQALVEKGFISQSRLDDARTAVEQGRQKVAELTATLKVAQTPARDDERAAAAATARAAEASLAQAQWREGQRRVVAPVKARVADTFFRVGEWVQPGQPVVSLLPPANIKARFYVPEGELASLAVGDAVTLHCDGCATPIAARVDRIATEAEYTPPVIYSNAQRSRLVFLVEARPDDPVRAGLKPGQPLDVRRTTP
ncbi:HlyD family secretion protein [Rhizobacter sp. Root1221]|uniref:HlyD family secretion protein n=1 Tax=Rhizobacter sp. Root1221 TaxID=1736433 RepID=UPI0006FF41DB|nr:HlyD family efflux transporter periplasmic adaptor subunit [Rhizobacter sp. Root1221]KQV95174.1 hypothetical protein ASC87_25285 [Rhizobacter sp. Root1221]